jgi:hypothetical protein
MPCEDSKLIPLLVRMVVPLRREFGRYLDVQHFLHDDHYAREVLKQASSSQDPRLRQQAEFIGKLQFGPRGGDAPLRVEAPATASSPPRAVEQSKPARDTAHGHAGPAAASSLSAEAEMKARIMKKYTSGLR